MLPTLSKIFERCIAKWLIDFLGKADIVYNKQFGFVKGRSTTHAIVELTEYIYGCLNKKEHCIGLFLYLTKAFDTVNLRCCSASWSVMVCEVYHCSG